MVAIVDYAQVPIVFEPDALRAMAQAFDLTCTSLHIPADMTREREVIATRIVDLARTGLVDPAVLRDRVMQEARLPPP